MRVLISFKHLEHTAALDSKIREKTQKLEKYLNGNTNVTWTCYVEDGLHYAEIQIKGPRFQYHAKAHADNLYKTLDKVVGKIETQVRKKKTKWKDHIHHKHEELYKGSIDVENGYGEDYIDDMFKKIA